MSSNILISNLKLLFIFSLFVPSKLSSQNLNIKDFGAIGNGKHLNTKHIQNAIDQCTKEGGKVIIPPGTYLSGSLELKSNVAIELLNGATIIGSPSLNDYKEHISEQQSYHDSFLRYSLFYAEKVNNIAIIGEGTIDGQGSAFTRISKENSERHLNRPFVIRFVECNNILIKGITLQNSAMWMQHYFACEFLTIDGIKVYNHVNHNNDMMDIDGCKNVIVSNCYGDTDDDGITLKSTSRKITENVTITNCVISSHSNAIKLGTESIGGFKNITISNIVVKPSESKSNPTGISGYPKGISGITLAVVDGGILDGVTINNIMIDGPQVPIYLRLGNRGRTIRPEKNKSPVGIYQNVNISNIIAKNTGQFGCSITGIPNHPLKNISFSNISINFKGGVQEEISLKVQELEEYYPESNMFGILPASAFFVRHAENISFDNVRISYEEKDLRYSMIIKDVNKLKINDYSIEENNSSNCVMLLDDVKNAFIEKPLIYSGKKEDKIGIVNGNESIIIK